MSLPTFQAQNPAISGYPLGWASCTTFAAAMVASYAKQVGELCTGGQVREQTGDHSGGTNLAQVDDALQHWDVDLDVRYRYPWDKFVARIKAGSGAILQGLYAPIAASRFDAGNGFRGNHAIAVFPGMVVMDPLADGRRANVYKYHGEAYPENLLEQFAGRLDLGGHSVGVGLVYAAFTQTISNPPAWMATIRPAGTIYTRYIVAQTQYGLQIRGRQRVTTKSGFSLPCTRPRLIWERPVGDGAPTKHRSLVQITGGNGSWVDSAWADPH